MSEGLAKVVSGGEVKVTTNNESNVTATPNTEEIKITMPTSPIVVGNKDENKISELEVLFAALFKSDDGVYERRLKLMSLFPDSSAFMNEFYIFYSMLRTNMKMTFTEHFLSIYLKANKGKIVKSNNIILSQFTFGTIDVFQSFADSCIKRFNACVMLKVSDADFETALEEAKMNYVQTETINILEEAAIIMKDGKKFGHKTLIGYEDMRSQLNLKLSKMDALNKTDGSKGFIVYDGNEATEDEETLKEIGKYGIKALDDKGMSIMEGDMISLLAPSKGGKSKFSVFLMHSMVVQGISVVSWSIENGYKGWESMMRARHFTYKWNKDVTSAQKLKYIDSEMIRKNTLTGDIKELESSSWMDLKSNKDYGRMLAIDKPFELNSFLDILEEAVDTIHAKFVCVDYLQLIEGDKGMTKAEAISKAYIKTLQFLKRKKIAGIFPAQLKQDAVKELNKMKPEDLGNAELRVSAGESYEVYKTPDVNFCLYGSPNEMKAGNMRLLLLPSRNVAPIPPINLAASFQTCTFVSV